MDLSYQDYFLLMIVFICLITDLKTRKILNVITYPAMLAGLVINILLMGIAPGAIFTLKGLFLGVLILWVPFAMGGLGAGDLKLLGVIGAFKGLTFTLWTGLYTAICGGIISLLIIIFDKAKRTRTINFIKRFVVAKVHSLEFDHETEKSKYYFPYSTAIIAGLLISYFL